MTKRRTFHGVDVTVTHGVPTRRGEGARVVFPDGTERIAVADESHPDIESASSYAVNLWRVDRWRAAGNVEAQF